jgi:argininosuccinate lyase
MSNQTPEGYLGTEGRISSGPAPELERVARGDAAMLHDGLHLADLAHVVVLAEQGLVPSEVARPLLRALLDLGEVAVADFPYDVRLGDAYNSRERELTRRAGDLAGWVHLGRTRREAGRIAFRLAVRDALLDLAEAVEDLAAALVDLADRSADLVWADTTYLQPAQPSTFGHYVASFAEEACRHLPRLHAAYDWVDISPAGSGGVGGTRLGLDRDALGSALGFARIGANTRDTMWNVDGLIDVLTAALQPMLTADRFAEDLEIFASPGFGLVELDASLCRASVLMPQKRNPYALAVIRAGASTMVGRVTGLMVTARTPSAQTDNWLHTYGEVTGSLALATRVVALSAVTARTLRVDRDALARTSADQQIAMTDLADELVLRTRVDYRTAYRITGRAIAVSLESGAPVTTGSLEDAAQQVTGAPLRLHDGIGDWDIDAVLDPELLVRTRAERGGCAPDSVRAEMSALRPVIAEAEQWRAARRLSNSSSRDALLDRAGVAAT